MRHVLIVEDNENVTSALQILLESAQWRVSIANSIADALVKSRHDPPHVALLDLSLPDGDGLMLAGPLRSFGTKKIVVLTGHDDRETSARCVAAGCDDVLIKPVSIRDLLEKSRAWTEGLE